MQDFEEYIRQGEPAQREKASTWQTAIGLQDVDGLKPSAYLLDTARRHVEGDITIDEVQQLIKTYYQSKTNHTGDEDDQEEADRAAANITRILGVFCFHAHNHSFMSKMRYFRLETNNGRLTPLGENEPTSRSLSTCHPHLGHVDIFFVSHFYMRLL